MDRIYMCIDLKSFYASVECVERNLDPLTTNLVVADTERTEKTICLAVSPALKSYGIPGRARLFEVIQAVEKINRDRFKKTKRHKFVGESISSFDLGNNPNLKLNYIAATPRMSLYLDYSARIYSIYLRYIAKEDIHVYSIDEVFMDITSYLLIYKMTPEDLCRKIIMDIYNETGITATGGVGTNMYLAKVSMDIWAKHMEPDSYGVRVAYLDEEIYKGNLWDHKPLTDFWRVGHGIANRLNEIGLFTMGDIARLSIKNEDILFRMFGINAELLIDHAWGIEPTTMEMIKAYKPSSNSMSQGQVLHCGYNYDDALVVVKEMAEALSYDLFDKGLISSQFVLSVGYDIDNLKDERIVESYKGELCKDYIGRIVPKPAHGTINLSRKTSSTLLIRNGLEDLYKKIVDRNLKIRRLNICAANLYSEDYIEENEGFEQVGLFDDIDAKIELEKKIDDLLKKERKNQKAILDIKKKYGGNAVLKGIDLTENATAIDRNKQIGGHKA